MTHNHDQEENTLLNTLDRKEFDTKREVEEYIRYLNKTHKTNFSKEDILTLSSDINYGEFTNILVDTYGIITYSYIETLINDGSGVNRYDIEFYSEIEFTAEALKEAKVEKNIQQFIEHYGVGKSASKLVKAYYRAFERQGKTGEEVIELLGEQARLLNL